MPCRGSSHQRESGGPSCRVSDHRWVRRRAIFGVPTRRYNTILLSKKPSLFCELLQLYRQIDMIKGYSTLNSTGFRKILKKHDKVTGIISMKATMAKIDAAPFNNFKKLDPIVSEIGE